MSQLETKRAEKIAAKEDKRRKSELLRVNQIKVAKQSVKNVSMSGPVRTRDEVLRRMEQLMSNRQLIHELMKYKYQQSALDAGPKTLPELHALRNDNIATKIKIFNATF